MAELQQDTIDRAVRWCAEAGRQTTPGEVRAALASLGWDQLLAARAILADPPPARPLGPHALADLARGVPADLAAAREREARYPRPGEQPGATATSPPTAAVTVAPGKKPGRRSRRSQVVVRKAKVAVAPASAQPPRRPLFEELLLPAGRGELERLIRTHGGRRPRLVAVIAATHRRADGAPLGDADLDVALEHHGLDRAFGRRERDELLHAVRAAGGVLALAATALGHDPTSLAAAITRLALDGEVHRLRETRRRDLRARATLSERAVLLVGSADKLADLGLVEEFERDLRQRLPEHLRALSTTGEPLELGLARSLSLPGATVRALMAGLGVEVRPPAAAPTPRVIAPEAKRRRPPREGPRDARPSGPRPSGPRPSGPRPSGSRPSGSRPSGPRPSGPRPSGPRPSGPRPSGPRPSGPRPSGKGPSGPRGGPRGPGR